MHSNVTIKNVS